MRRHLFVLCLLVFAAVPLWCFALRDEPDKPLPEPILITLNPTSITGGNSFNLQASFAVTRAYNRVVSISTDHPSNFVDLPSSITVYAGYTSNNQDVDTYTVGDPVTARITGSYMTYSDYEDLDIDP